MKRSSPHAETILHSKFADHPALLPLTQALAADPSMTWERARRFLSAAASDLKIGELAMEHSRYSNVARPSLAPTDPAAPADGATFMSGVISHLNCIDAARRSHAAQSAPLGDDKSFAAGVVNFLNARDAARR